MIRHVIALTSLSLGCVACATTPAAEPAQPASATSAKKASAKTKKASKKTARAGKSEPSAGSAEKIERKLGDFYVHQFTGSFSEKPLTLTEQVVAMEDDLLVVDFVLQEGEEMTALRVRMRPEAGNEVVSVARIGAEDETPATIADYEALLARTQLVPEGNDATLGSDAETCLVGDLELDCVVTAYKVWLEGGEATLSVTQSTDLPGRDIGGEITGPDGALLYRARLVEMGNEAPIADAMAMSGKLDAR